MRNPDRLPGGADICAEDGVIRWDSVKTARTQFVMIKASEGGEDGAPCTADPMFLENTEGAYTAGLRVGAYHWFTGRSVEDAKEQAAFFLEQIGRAGVMINFYCGVVLTELDESCESFLYAEVFMGLLSQAGYKPVLYAPPALFEDYILLDLPVWLPCLPEEWDSLSKNLRSRVVLWQYRTDSMRGIDADMMRSVLLRPEVLMNDDFNASVIPYRQPGTGRSKKKSVVPEADWAIRLGIWRSEGEFDLLEEINREELMIMYRRFYDMWEAAHR